MKQLEKPLEPSFKNDLKEFTSPTNFVVGFLGPLIVTFVFNKENWVKNLLIVLSLILKVK